MGLQEEEDCSNTN